METNKLIEEIREFAHNIFTISVICAKEITEDEMCEINYDSFKIWQKIKDLENEILKLEDSNNKLTAELLLAEATLDKITDGNGAEEMNKLTPADLIKSMIK